MASTHTGSSIPLSPTIHVILLSGFENGNPAEPIAIHVILFSGYENETPA